MMNAPLRSASGAGGALSAEADWRRLGALNGTMSPATALRRRLARWAFRRLARGGRTLAVPAGDAISEAPILFGDHEPHMMQFFAAAAGLGFADFLIDIGANIGLSSCLSERHFEVIHAFEPNPLAFRLLEVNVAGCAAPEKFRLHPFGIGRRDALRKLMVPRGNWGGAFLAGDGNGYDAATLAGKDGFARFDPANYTALEVAVRGPGRALAPVFAQIAAAGGARGVIKIDVEGFEAVVLKALAETLPEGMRAVIVFENWDAGFDCASVLRKFRHGAACMRLRRRFALRRPPQAVGAGRGVAPGFHWSMEPHAGPAEGPGDMVILAG